jgi:1-deoxy-D-xylulose-5-phosphate reductoisomerase
MMTPSTPANTLSADLNQSVTILGATGSVGQSTRQVILDMRAHYGEQVFPVRGVTAQTSVEKLAETAIALRAECAVVGDDTCLADLRDALSGSGIKAAAGLNAICEAAASAQWVMAAITGAAGLAPILAAARAGAKIALANKEALVCAGALCRDVFQANATTVLPIDSEHNAVFQTLETRAREAIRRVTLTASGGPFRDWTAQQMASASIEDAIAHPNWDMGAKISVDSATLMNKGLELIEAHYLFDLPESLLDAVIHPQSIIHAMVQYADGSVLAHMGAPDMKTPIAQCLHWPERGQTGGEMLDICEIARLEFEKPDTKRFPALGLAKSTIARGASAPLVLNAANEVAVQAFLSGEMGFAEIVPVVEDVLNVAEKKGLVSQTCHSLDEVVGLDREIRALALPMTTLTTQLRRANS